LINEEPLDKKFQKELQSGITALILLSVLARATQPMYGYQIAKRIGAEHEDASLKQGVFYPALRSLESSGLLSSMVEPSVSGPPRRYYSITDLGRNCLSRWAVIWRDTKDFVDSIVEETQND
jgi:PadR family transcriptional regulator PadR